MPCWSSSILPETCNGSGNSRQRSATVIRRFIQMRSGMYMHWDSIRMLSQCIYIPDRICINLRITVADRCLELPEPLQVSGRIELDQQGIGVCGRTEFRDKRTFNGQR